MIASFDEKLKCEKCGVVTEHSLLRAKGVWMVCVCNTCTTLKAEGVILPNDKKQE